MAEKVTIMVLKVDLQCDRCYRKVKKILCKFPQIRSQMYDEKHNTVTITVVCCSPEKIRKKLCCKGGGSIKCIEIVEPPKPKPPEKPKEPEKPPKQPEKPKEPEKPKQPEKPKECEKPKPPPEKPKPLPEKPQEEKPKPPEKPKPMPVVAGYPPILPVGVCCFPCYFGYGWGQCQGGHGGPPPHREPPGRPPCHCEPRPCHCGPRPCHCEPPPCHCGPRPFYEGYGRPIYDSYGGNTVCYVTRSDYFCEENPSACTIM